MTTTSPLQPARTPRGPALPRPVAMQLAATEYDRMAASLAGLSAADWTLPTDCPAWDVRELACHLVGMAAMPSTPWETARQQRLAGRDQRASGAPMVDCLTALQVRERSHLGPDDLVEAARKIAPRAARGRRLTPGFVRRRTMPGTQVVNGREEQWTLGYLIDVILTRDPWMHRIDLARATGHDLDLTEDHDGVIVDDVVREWAGRHGRPYRLELTGPAGGTWASTEQPKDTEDIAMDAIEFGRTLSGRATGVGLLTTQVPF